MMDIFQDDLGKDMPSEQLDKMIVITSPLTGMMIIGSGLIIVAVIIWAVFSQLFISVNTNGVIISNDEGKQQAICYINISNGKKIDKGMEVILYPETVINQEYGHMRGMVISVEPYVTSEEDIEKRLDNEELVNLFTKNGPVVEVVCSIQEDDTTASGFYWSNKKGKDVIINEGTLFAADIVIDKKSPISIIFPYLNE